MKRLYIIRILIIFIGLSGVGCVDDKGNYDYSELNELTIGTFEKNYIVEQFTHLKIEPEIVAKKGFDPENYEYLWIIMGMYLDNSADTLSHEKNLDAEVSKAPGEYSINFVVKDKQTKVTCGQTSYIQVVNSYSVGLLTLSRVGNDANVCFLNVANTLIEDAYQKVNGCVVGKNPTKIRYVKGALSKAQKVVVIMTDDERGGTVVNHQDMEYIMDFRDLFYFPPKVVKPQSFGLHDYTAYEYVINDGDIYTRKVMGNEPFPKYGVRVKGDYRVAPFDFFSATNPQFAFFYDQKNERFVGMGVPLQGDAVIPLERDTASVFDPSDMKMQMVWGALLGSMFSMNSGRAVMKDHIGDYYMIAFKGNKVDDALVMTPLAMLPLDIEGIEKARCFTSPQSAQYLYYAYDNKIACVSFTTGNLMSVYEFPDGQVDYIECDQVNNINHMWVGISDGSTGKKSGSIVFMDMSTDGSLKEVKRYPNVCGQVVDFEYKK